MAISQPEHAFTYACLCAWIVFRLSLRQFAIMDRRPPPPRPRESQRERERDRERDRPRRKLRRASRVALWLMGLQSAASLICHTHSTHRKNPMADIQHVAFQVESHLDAAHLRPKSLPEKAPAKGIRVTQRINHKPCQC